MYRRSLVACFAAICLVQVGCNNVPDGPRTVPAEGVVTLDGTPVSGAAVVFVAANGEHSATCASEEDGKFSLNAFEYKTGAVPGEYMAVITKNEEVKMQKAGKDSAEEQKHAEEGGGEQVGVVNIMPKQYSQPNPSFTFTVPEDGVSDLKIELTSK